MAKTTKGRGGETHQIARGDALTTNQGTVISDGQNSLKTGARGPTLLEDFVLREKITHFDHERIPERIVHARGSGAHGYFQPYADAGRFCKAKFLQDPRKRTPVFARFSTVAGGAGSVDTPRDVRGFAVKLYTEEGNFDLVGNNMPVFFIQDAIKFPDLIHSVKMEPDRGFPQAASAHDTFWDFVSLMPESLHTVVWAMSDRAIPRSLRMMEGFGIHTFRFIDENDNSRFVKFHWRPKNGAVSTLWDEAVKIAGADPDYHRRDLYEAIQKGDFPEWEFSVQIFDQKTADKLPFDILDATKLIPEEIVPLTPLGKMVLDRNPDNFFAETEQVAFHPGHVVPGIDFTNDPLLQGRLFSYTDTQLSRLGGPNFHEIPVNRPKCPMHNFQRDGIARQDVSKGRVSYEPNSLDPSGPREDPKAGFTTFQDNDKGGKVRERSPTFADHYSQPRMFFRSQTPNEQQHIINAFSFELAKVQTLSIRKRMLGHLAIIDGNLSEGVESQLGMEGQREAILPARRPIDLPLSPMLSLLHKAKKTLVGRKVACVVADGSDRRVVDALRAAVEKAGGSFMVLAPKIGGVPAKGGQRIVPDETLAGAPSVLFEVVALVLSPNGAHMLAEDPGAVDWVANAYNHLKVIGHTPGVEPLLERANAKPDSGVIPLGEDVSKFISAAKAGKFWRREK